MATVWRYQPVVRVTEFEGITDACVSLCEVIMNDDEELIAWTEDMSCSPLGADVEELVSDVALMWIDAMSWKPVFADALEVGMKFEKSIDQAARNELAEFIEHGGSLLKHKST
ncbi:hypothetical protein [uncultured Sulfitobacter sp.]|uniref:hypothetical protein n=1 Tax=uncultured Sulfitobacter sp. TaxID=191468 RepID=UPI00261A5BFC|nr:hypothetical protein [uncultured Sulfitobacter sp.]